MVQARDFLHQCFNRVPRDRPNATRLLKHPWLENVQLPSARAAAAVATAAAAAASSSFGTSSNPVLRHHPAANSMMMQPSSGLWSPPSPIKEEPEGPLLSAAASAQPPAPQTAAHAPPSAAKKQLQMNQAADTAAPQAALQQQQAPMAASLHLTVPAPCPNAAAEQFDTIYSPSQIPSGLLAADKSAQEGAAPAANAGLPVAPKPPTGVMLDPEAEVDRQLLHLALYGSISIPEGHNCTAAGSIGGEDPQHKGPPLGKFATFNPLGALVLTVCLMPPLEQEGRWRGAGRTTIISLPRGTWLLPPA